MPVTTRKGDDGSTDTFDGRRVSKASLDIELMGALDETNAFLGFAKAHVPAGDVNFRDELHSLQKDLCSLMGAYSASDALRSTVKQLLPGLDTKTTALQPLADSFTGFIVPGETVLEGALHLARVVCRRAERIAVRKAQEDQRYHPLATYLNRLSDVFFLFAVRSRSRPA